MLFKNAKTVLTVLLVLFGIVMLLCGLIIWALFHFIIMPISEKQDENKKAYEAFVESINNKAIAYVEEKYGFTAEITETVQDRKYGMFGSTPLERGGVYMTYDSTSFCVYYDMESDIGYDDYQYEEVYAAVEDIFRANGTGFAEMCVQNLGSLRKGVCDELEDIRDRMLHICYDGNNLGEVLAYAGATVAGCYTGGEDFSTYTDWQIPETLYTAKGEPIELLFVSFRTKDYPWALNHEEFISPTAANYVSSYGLFKSGTPMQQRSFVLHDYNGAFQYCIVSPDGAAFTVDDATITITPTTAEHCDWELSNNYLTTKTAFHITAAADCTMYLFFNREQRQALMPGDNCLFSLAKGDNSNADYCFTEYSLDSDIRIYRVEVRLLNDAAFDLYPLYRRPSA